MTTLLCGFWRLLNGLWEQVLVMSGSDRAGVESPLQQWQNYYTNIEFFMPDGDIQCDQLSHCACRAVL